ncbi:MAG: hypothetical protein KBD21_02670 [Candidatus Pacebacteria bacterium]|nr:hypothetical protein [Candidatus Paceibacterota bacterium]
MFCNTGAKTAFLHGNEECFEHVTILDTTVGLSLEERTYERDIFGCVDPSELLIREQFRKRSRSTCEPRAQVVHFAVRDAHRTLLRHDAESARKGRYSRT